MKKSVCGADYILFDLDGTLTDSRPGIFHSIRYALEQYGIKASDEQLQPFLGPPLVDSFMEHFGFSKKQAEEAVAQYRVYFNPRGMMENAVYEGVPQMLGRLRDAGKHLMVATSKPEEYARRILEHFDLAPYFEIIAGASMDESRSSKAAVLRYLLAQIPDASEAAKRGGIRMVGDRKYDVLGAKELGLPCVGVSYGYAAPGELAAAGAAAIAGTPEELCELLLDGYSA